MKRIVALLLVAFMLLGSAGALSAVAEAQTGGTLVIVSANPGSGAGFPATGAIHEAFYSAPAIESLFYYNLENGGFDPWLAESYEIDSQALTLTIKVKEGIKFHDGTPFNAQAVARNYQIMKEYNVGGVKTMESVEALDDITVVIHLKKYTNATLIEFLVNTSAMISPTHYDLVGEGGCYAHPCGTGPFVADIMEHGVEYSYVRNNNYWRENEPKLDGIRYIFCSDSTTATRILRSGEANLYFLPTTLECKEMTASGFLQVANAAAYSNAAYGIAFNSIKEDEPTANLLVRQAICYAIDTEAIANVLGNGYYWPTNQAAVKGSPEYNEDVVGYPYNPDKARELLAEAGYQNGCKVTLTYQAPQEGLFTLIQSYLEDVGITCEFDVVDSATYSTRMLMAGGAPFKSICYLSASTVKEKFMNYFSSSPTMYAASVKVPDDVKALVDKLSFGTDVSQIYTECKEMQRLIIDEYCLVLPMYVAPYLCLSDGKLMDSDVLYHVKQQWKPGLAYLAD